MERTGARCSVPKAARVGEVFRLKVDGVVCSVDAFYGTRDNGEPTMPSQMRLTAELFGNCRFTLLAGVGKLFGGEEQHVMKL